MNNSRMKRGMPLGKLLYGNEMLNNIEAYMVNVEFIGTAHDVWILTRYCSYETTRKYLRVLVKQKKLKMLKISNMEVFSK